MNIRTCVLSYNNGRWLWFFLINNYFDILLVESYIIEDKILKTHSIIFKATYFKAIYNVLNVNINPNGTYKHIFQFMINLNKDDDNFTW